MNTLQEVAKFAGESSPISMRIMAGHFLFPSDSVSMRDLIKALENLPVLKLENKVSPRRGKVPFDVKLSHKYNSGVYTRSIEWRVLRNALLVATFGFDQSVRLETPGNYIFSLTYIGVDKTGFKEVKPTAWSVIAEPGSDDKPSGGKAGGNVGTGGSQPFTFCIVKIGSGILPQNFTIYATNFDEAEKILAGYLPGNLSEWNIRRGPCTGG